MTTLAQSRKCTDNNNKKPHEWIDMTHNVNANFCMMHTDTTDTADTIDTTANSAHMIANAGIGCTIKYANKHNN